MGASLPRGARVALASAASALLVLAAFLLAPAVVGWRLDGACMDRQPPELWAPVELAMASTQSDPAPAGLITFRCQADAAPRWGFEFTDPVPLLIVWVTGVVCVCLLALVWMPATRSWMAAGGLRPERRTGRSRPR